MLGADLATILPDTADICEGCLHIGESSVAQLAGKYGTPLYIYDRATLQNLARRARDAFSSLEGAVSYAPKACALVGILEVFREEGLDLDVVSLGEIQAGLHAGFAPEQMHLHGNYKTDAELEAAVDLGLRATVLDNLEEIGRLDAIATNRNKRVPVWLRFSLPLEAETHPHLQTGGPFSKFGFVRASPEEQEAISRLSDSRWLDLVGVHAHVGSQIADASIFKRVAEELLGAGEQLSAAGFPIRELVVGGGWAVPYRPGELALEMEDIADAISKVLNGSKRFGLRVEPGRALVARAGIAVYSVGSVKQREDRRLIAVDGGMGDNIRPALYGADYYAMPARGIGASPTGPADVVGRYCEAGDVLVRGAMLPQVKAGDLLCIPVAGAYQLALASNYNLVPRPAAILVSNGDSASLLRRETTAEMLGR